MSNYKVRGSFNNNIKSVELARGDFSVARLKSGFAKVCQGPVLVTYKGKQLLKDDDVKFAVTDSRRSKQHYVDVVLRADGPRTASSKSSAKKAAPRRTQQSTSGGSSSTRSTSSSKTATKAQPPQGHHRPSGGSSSSSSGGSLEGGVSADIRAELNKLRSNPRGYCSLLEKRLEGYDGKQLRIRRGGTLYRTETREGASACQEAVDALIAASAQRTLQFPAGLEKAAHEVQKLLGPEGANRPSSEELGDAIRKHGRYTGNLSQVISFLYDKDAQEMVLDLLICDGDNSRHTRNLLLNADYTIAGVGLGEGNPQLTVIMLVSGTWE